MSPGITVESLTMKTLITAFFASILVALAAAGRAEPLAGQIVIDPDHPHSLKRYGGTPVFICGPGDPEGFLYRGTRRPDGTRDGDQRALIDKLAQHGGNCIYMQAVRTHGGDAGKDLTQNPFVDSDPTKGIDARILDQWEQWFTQMDEHGILIYLFFYDDGARIWNTGDEVGPEERTFLETIVAKFQHHRNLIWVFAEESEERYSRTRVNAAATIIRHADRHDHLVGDHHHSGPMFKSWDPAGALNHYSMQLNVPVDGAHAGAIEARRVAAGRYQVIYSENTAMLTDVDGMRRHAWAVAMGGVMPMLLRMEIANTPVESLEQCRYLQRFFESTDFPTLTPHDELAHDGTKYVLADLGRSYIAYAPESTSTLGLISLPVGRCEVTWLDCRTGRTSVAHETFATAGDRNFKRPANIGPECAAWIRFPDIAPRATPPVVAAAASIESPRPNRAPATSDHTFATRAGAAGYVQLRFADDDGPGPYTYTVVEKPRHGTLSGDDNDRTYTPAAGFTGRDFFTWRVNDGAAESAVARVNIDVIPGPAAPAPQPTLYFPPPESQGGWRKLTTPDEVRRAGGMDPAKLVAVEQWLRSSDERDFAAVVIRHGQVVFEVERGNSAKTDSRRVASVSKAVLAAVLAIASERSQQGLTPHRMTFDDPAFHFIPWAQPLSDPRKERITIRQLLNHTSGIAPEATGVSNNGTWDFVLGHTGDPRTAKLAFDPGMGCGYSTHGMYHAALVCEYVTGEPYDRFAIEHLFRPIGIEHWEFQFFDGSEKVGRHPNHNLGMPARDLARIAYCMLQGGRWAGRQVIPAWFINDLNAPRAATGIKEMRWGFDSAFYGEGWSRPLWTTGAEAPGRGVTPADARQKHGSGGQYIAYVPSLDLVITRQTGASGQWDYEEFLARVCGAVIK
jgi:CubicO group peptidase (beta-lactamase class C family)